jgi:hypothetical protein
VKAFILVVAIAAALIGVAAPVDASTDERRVALVVGNSRYADAPLRNPANDARAMAATLRERGFDVLLRVDANKQQMESGIIEFGEKLTEGATGLFFFAGHGMQVQGRNYIIPTDAKLTSEQRIKLEAIDIDAVLDQMQGARSKVNVVILDACRNNPFERRFRSASGGLAQINAPEGTLIAYATAPGRVAADGDGANGLYTTELLKALRTPGLKVEDVFKQVRINVARASNGAQTPWEASSLIGDFYFVPPAPVTAALSNSAEAEFWESIKDAGDPNGYRVYLTRYPKGEFADLAQVRLTSLDSAPVGVAEKVRIEAAEKTRLEIEAIRRETAERSRLEIEKARQEATEKSRVEIEKARQAVAAAPSPSVSISGQSLDGAYNARFTMIGTTGFSDINAAIEIFAGQILGKASTTTTADSCTLTGSLDRGTGEIIALFMSCLRLNAHFKGRFAVNPQTGQIEGRTEARAVSDGRNIPVVWRP